MSSAPSVQGRIQAYLDSVRSALSSRPEDVREELLRDLECQIRESLDRRAPGRTPTPEEVEAVLAEMGSPASFAEPSAAPLEDATPVSRSSGPARWLWFALGLALLLVNVAGWWRVEMRYGRATVLESFSKEGELYWRFSADMQPEEKPAAISPQVEGRYEWPHPRLLKFRPETNWPPATTCTATLSPALRTTNGRSLEAAEPILIKGAEPELVGAEQAELTADRNATIQLQFNVLPDLASLEKQLSLTDSNGKTVPWRLLSQIQGAPVLIRTEPVLCDQLTLCIKEGLKPLRGDLVSSKDQTKTVTLSAGPVLLSMEARTPSFDRPGITLSFNQSINAERAKAFLNVEPQVSCDVSHSCSWDNTRLHLAGDFKPNQVYSITLRAGLPAENGQTLTRDITRAVQIPNRSPAITIPVDGRFLSPFGPMRIPVEAVNLREAVLQVRPLRPDNLPYYLLREKEMYDDEDAITPLLEDAKPVKVQFPDQPNERISLYVNLPDFTGADPRGAYLMTLCAPTGPYSSENAHQLIMVTDLALTAKQERERITVWATSLHQATPISGAEVRVIAKNLKELARGTTDASGIAMLDLPKDAESYAVIASLSNDVSYLVFQGKSAVDAGPAQQYDVYDSPGMPDAMVYTDREIYRPGETVHIQTIVRDETGSASPPFPLLLRVSRPDGKVYCDLPLSLNERGAASLEVTVPDYLPTGSYRLDAVLPGTFELVGGSSVIVEDFVPPQVAVKMTVPKDRIRAGALLKASLDAQYLFGSPAARLSSRPVMTVASSSFKATSFPDYIFGDPEKTFSSVYNTESAQALDENGHRDIEFKTLREWRPPAALRAVISATVTETGGRPVYADASVWVDCYPFYIGLRTGLSGTSIKTGVPLRMEAVTVSPEGATTNAVRNLRATLSKVNWSHALRRNSGRGYEWVSERELTAVQEFDVVITNGFGVVEISAQDPGSHLLSLRDPASGASTSVMLEASSPEQEWVNASMERPDRVELRLDRKEYAPGGTAELTIQSPFAGTALLTVERDRVLEHRVLQLDGNRTTVSLPVQESWTPNVWCTVSVLKPAKAEELWSSHRALGTVLLSVKPPERKLAVKIETPATLRPQTELPVLLTVTDTAGAPVDAEVTLAAVDEAICSLTKMKTPDPFEYFLRPRGPGIEQYDIFSELLPVLSDARIGTAIKAGAGDDGESMVARRLNPIRGQRFKPVALWKAGIRTDTNGVAAVTLAVPEFTGKLRLMAVAFDVKRGGCSTSAAVVKRPLVVQPALPRFLAPGDACDSAIGIFNHTGQDTPVDVALKSDGPACFAVSSCNLVLKAGASTQLVVRVTAAKESAGLAHLTYAARAGEERYEETIELPVRPASAPEVRIARGKLKADQQTSFQPPSGWLAGTLHADLWASGRPETAWKNGLEYLLRYPYGCIEQTTSSVFPLLYLGDLLQRQKPGAIAAGDTETLVKAGILRIFSMQTSGGDFAYWPHSSLSVGGWTSIYATHFLVEARKAGHEVDDTRLKLALDALQYQLDSPLKISPDQKEAWSDDLESRAYACHVLALAGRPMHGWNARLLELAPRLSYAARMHLTLALKYAGHPAEAESLLRSAGLPPEQRPRRFGGCLGGAASDAALALMSWLAVDPEADETEVLAQRIESLGNSGCWLSTQETSYALLALGKRLPHVPARPEPFSGIFTTAKESRAFDLSHPLHFTAPEDGALEGSILANKGPGPLLYALRYEGVPTQPAKPAGHEPIQVTRTVLAENGDALDPAQPIRQGDRVVIRLRVDPHGLRLDNVVISDLLPAGFELENPSVAAEPNMPWLEQIEGQKFGRRTEMRDDRLLVFTGEFNEPFVLHYTVRAVTPGTYVWPSALAEAMYDPSVRGLSELGSLQVEPIAPASTPNASIRRNP